MQTSVSEGITEDPSGYESKDWNEIQSSKAFRSAHAFLSFVHLLGACY